MMKTKEYRETIAQAFLESLKENPKEWKEEWQSVSGCPVNATNNKKYKGLNRFWLSYIQYKNGWDDPRWCTFNQIVDNGWHLKKGSKGAKVEYWMPYDPEAKKALTWSEYAKKSDAEKEKLSLRARYYTVFNAVQIEGMPERCLPEERDIHPAEIVSAISSGMGVAILNDGGNNAFYRPSEDKIHLPEAKYFMSDYAYNSTALHELAHATGHPSRLNRKQSNGFGTRAYAYEELIAEITSCFLSEYLPLQFDESHFDNHKAYIDGWIQVIEEKPEALMKAIKEAESAANYMEAASGISKEKTTLEEFLGERGLESPVSDFMVDKTKIPRGLTTKQRGQFEHEGSIAVDGYHELRQAAIKEYRAKVVSGEIIEKSQVETLLDKAKGNPELEQVQAARRLLEKKGVKWEEYFTEVAVVQNGQFYQLVKMDQDQGMCAYNSNLYDSYGSAVLAAASNDRVCFVHYDYLESKALCHADKMNTQQPAQCKVKSQPKLRR